MRSDDLQGWVVDLQLGENGDCMDVWMINKSQNMHKITVPWCANIHVHATNSRLSNLRTWLKLPEIRNRFSIGATRIVKKRLSLDAFELHNVLEIDVLDSRNIRKLAQHIETYGDYHNFTLYSVDAHLAQRFFIEYRISPFQLVDWNGHSFSLIDENNSWPRMKVIELDFDYESSNGFKTVDSSIKKVRIFQWEEFLPSNNLHLVINKSDSNDKLLEDLMLKISEIDPDIIITKGGDRLHFPALKHISEKCDFDFNISRKNVNMAPRTMSRVVHSYGQVIRKDSYFPLHGRLHIDLEASFIVREGGILGLFELARHSRQSPQDISRLSPGSVISAIQMRVAMEDSVLVPWKKNRAEDTKTAWELLIADRGGMYLDSKPGVYSDVIELDFASLFPSIIATRNISPETLNCACCQAVTNYDLDGGFVPLNPEDANRVFRERNRKGLFGSKLFPLENPSALQVPGLKTHTCAQVQGFLGRVVAPLIQRRMELKQQRKRKGDVYDLQQNALKWLLVTCFGYTGYKNARFGRIEAHEAICAWAREILLTTISIAEDQGWNVLHAIVDCVWIENPNLKTRAEKIDAAKQLSRKITDAIGIPLEFEDVYDFIGFLPSRMHGSGSLTKYWAHGQNGFKLRGIESRQHSTCKWIVRLQNRALEIMKKNYFDGGRFNSISMQNDIVKMLHRELRILYLNKIEPQNLVVTRRVTKHIHEFSVSTSTQQALIRAKALGHEILPGRKVRFVITKNKPRNPVSRVMLSEELEGSDSVEIDFQHYRNLAVRAIWAILSPFGWTDEEIESGCKKYTLFDFIGVFDSKSTMDDSAC